MGDPTRFIILVMFIRVGGSEVKIGPFAFEELRFDVGGILFPDGGAA